MPAIYASEESLIDKPISEIFTYVRDFEKWPEWSPWLICEPDTKLEFQPDSYTWEGKVVGAGKMSVVNAKENEEIVYKLEFLKPWKSEADVRIVFAQSGEKTRVKWVMDSSLPWFMFFMKSMMERMISMDYQRGLRMLKELMETGKLQSVMSYEDRVPIPACDYLGIERTCSMDDMPKLMEEDFVKLPSVPESARDLETPMFTIYSEWKISKGLVSYTVCCPVKEVPSEIPSGMIVGKRPACEAFGVMHKGSYSHLGNAWASAMMRAQAKLFKQDKKVPPFEQYMNDPGETAEAELLTRVCLPMKD